jgi:hypothetical protein
LALPSSLSNIRQPASSNSLLILMRAFDSLYNFKSPDGTGLFLVYRIL